MATILQLTLKFSVFLHSQERDANLSMQFIYVELLFSVRWVKQYTKIVQLPAVLLRMLSRTVPSVDIKDQKKNRLITNSVKTECSTLATFDDTRFFSYVLCILTCLSVANKVCLSPADG